MKCDYCTEKCPQSETIREIAKGRMYATNEVVKLQKQLEEYKDLEKQGLLLRLPCKVGDTVWCIFEGNVYEAIAQKVTIVTGLDNYQLIKIEAEFNIIDPYYNDGRTIKYGIYQNYLETVFLTQAEAEQKLKETEGD